MHVSCMWLKGIWVDFVLIGVRPVQDYGRQPTYRSHVVTSLGNSKGILTVYSSSSTQYRKISVTYYLELRNAIIVYCASHFLPTMVELVVCTLYIEHSHLYLVKKYINSRKDIGTCNSE